MNVLLRKLDHNLGGWPQWRITACGLLLVALLASADHFTGPEISFSVFYLIPIVFTAWFGGKRLSRVICLVSAAAWMAVDMSGGHLYSRSWIYFWNAGVRLVFFVLTAALVEEFKLRLQLERHSARTDSLTGLKNAFAFREDADLLFKTANRHRFPIAMGFFDLDGFKAVNDRIGHAEGDRVLKAVGATLAVSVRESDIAARLGGDEFAVVLPHTDMPGARTFFDRLHQRLWRAMEDDGWAIGFSIGVAVFGGEMPGSGDALQKADALMYRAKTSGRNKIIYEEIVGDADSLPDTKEDDHENVSNDSG